FAVQYTSSGGLWVTSNGAIVGGGSVNSAPVTYAQAAGASGEHAYYDPSNPLGSVAVRPTQFNIGFDGSAGGPPTPFLQLGTWMYMVGGDSFQRAFPGYTGWVRDTSYKVARAEGELWSERSVCTASGEPGATCGAGFPACPQGSTCNEVLFHPPFDF